LASKPCHPARKDAKLAASRRVRYHAASGRQSFPVNGSLPVPKRTVLFDRHERLGGRIVDFHGWLLPVQYEGILAEHAHCRRSVVVFDTCHMGQIAIRGAEAAGELSRLLTQDAAALPVGRARYGLL
ncbi:MAG TPA: hypothetical protein DCX07_00315, partial [Phycisphaerales bacterium]|nr:hypothetical protein [Phycisphaerales bacterium]